MHHAALVVALVTAACSRDTPDRPPSANHYFAYHPDTVERKFEVLADPRLPIHLLDLHLMTDSGAPNEYQFAEAFRVATRRHNIFNVSLSGESGFLHRVCRVHIGPNTIREPLSLDLIYALVDDPLIERDLRAAIGSLDVTRAYLCELEVDGVRVRLEQFDGFEGPVVDLLLDGCDRSPPDDADHVRFIGQELEFERGDEFAKWNVPNPDPHQSRGLP